MRFNSFIVFLILTVLILLGSCDENVRKFQQYYSYGQIVYESECASCHGIEGKPSLPIIPPLANADYMLEDTLRTLCIINRGMSGPIQVNGKTYNMRMPASVKINKVEMAYLLTFLYAKWGESERVFEPAELDSLYDQCGSYELNILNE